jgi:parvulin-like peptidyl-prolyl isomerase
MQIWARKRLVAATMIVAVAAGSMSLSFAQTPTMGDDPVVARIGDREVHASTIKRALAGVPAFELAALGTTKFDILKKYVDEAMVREELLAIAAKNRGALDDRAVGMQLRKASAGVLVRKSLAALGGREGIPIAEVQAYYEQHKAEYQTPERVRIAHIVVATKADADAVLAKVLSDPTREGWAKLCADTSLDPNTKRTAGDLGFVSVDGRSSEPKVVVPKKLAEVAFTLKDGDIAKEPVQTEAGWHVLWRRGSVPPLVRTLEMEEPTIRELLFEKKQQDTYKSLLEKLRAQTPVEIDEELIPIPTIDVGPRPVPKK